MSTHLPSYHVFETALGFCAFAWSTKGIVRFQLVTPTADSTERHLRRRAEIGKPDDPPQHLGGLVIETQRYFSGAAADFSAFSVDLEGQNELFLRIYASARGLSWGQTTTYGAIAKSIGAGPEVARDVGQAMAKNPVALIIPCHRVLAAGGKSGGFSAPGGIKTKLQMLALEGINLPTSPRQASLDL